MVLFFKCLESVVWAAENTCAAKNQDSDRSQTGLRPESTLGYKYKSRYNDEKFVRQTYRQSNSERIFDQNETSNKQKGKRSFA